MEHLDDAALGRMTLAHLEEVVAIDSASDESSSSVPSTPGQAALAAHLQAFYETLGAPVERDEHANVIARIPGRGAGADKAPLALMIHLDTARGTAPLPHLVQTPDWQGDAVPYADAPHLQVDIASYPELEIFRGHTLIHGTGRAPFGLDDKLGLAHCMTLAKVLLHIEPSAPTPPLLLIARPDEEIGREEALHAVAELLVREGVSFGYTVDGLWPYEINVENFNAAGAFVRFEASPVQVTGPVFRLQILGVDTHGATAKSEGHRAATRLAAELLAAGMTFLSFESDAHHDCNSVALVEAPDEALLHRIIGPHLPRGAGWSLTPWEGEVPSSSAAPALLAWISDFFASAPGFVLPAEESDGYQGYTAPYRARAEGDGLRLDLRIRDFTPEGLQARIDHVHAQAGDRVCEHHAQYDNMGPALADRPELRDRALQAAGIAGLDAPVRPIRGGTGVGPFLDRGVPIGNLGTGYFAPESAKELTSLEHMAGHARWLVALCQVLAEG